MTFLTHSLGMFVCLLFGVLYAAGAVSVHIMIHGYRSSAERDFGGGLSSGIESGSVFR